MSSTKEEIANKIRLATRRRAEESNRIWRLQQERRAEMKEQELEEAASRPSGLIPYIIIFLVFLSLPLSEPIIDWVLVGSFVVLNGMWATFFRSYSWVNWALLFLCNLSLVRMSHVLPQIPKMVRELPPEATALYIAVNTLVAVGIYFVYVEQKTPWSMFSRGGNKTRRTKKSEEELKKESLEEFAQRRDKLNRLDLAASGMLLGNVAALVCLGVIPRHVIFDSIRQLIAFFH
ncbi:hypothetical protein TRVL_10160 [Trypanosoma vivax]|nr:hypothetical protein TRVL_10160 [Trypanosoma vivax]